MQSGKFNKRVTIQQPSVVNEDGEAVVTWNDVATIWANIKYLSGRELERAQQLHEASVTITVRNRWLPSTYRLIYRETQFDVVSVIPDEKNTELSVTCVARRNTTYNFVASGGAGLEGLATVELIEA